MKIGDYILITDNQDEDYLRIAEIIDVKYNSINEICAIKFSCNDKDKDGRQKIRVFNLVECKEKCKKLCVKAI